MQRRAVNAATSTQATTGTPSRQTPTQGTAAATRRPSHRHPIVSNCILIIVAIILTLASYLMPSHHQAGRMEQQILSTEQRVLEQAYQTEQSLEQELNGMFHHHNPATTANAASVRMEQQQNSRWVDGEKKLKAKLKELAALQAAGKEIGVPVATRWLGDDIPVWAGTGVDVDEWRKKVDARYAEMREEEEEWKKMVAATLKLDQS